MCLDKDKIRQSFSAAAASYDDMAVLQRQVGKDLLSRFEFQTTADTVLDLGCGTGFLTGELLALLDCNTLLALDIAFPMLQTMQQKIQHPKVAFICADAEQMPLATASINHLFSSLALQWCQNLPSVLKDFRRVVKAEGQLLISIFGPATLQELKTAWAKIDDYSHVNAFYSGHQITRFVQQAGFSKIELESLTYQTAYADVMTLMQELKGIGAHNVTLGRNKKTTTRRQLQRMMEAYEKQCPDGIIASYEIILLKAVAR